MKTASSTLVLHKATIIEPTYLGRGAFVVPSATKPGTAYTAKFTGGMLADFTAWTCTCDWAQHGGCGCAHVRSALAMTQAARAAAERLAA